MASGYKKLEIFNLAFELSLKVHKMSLTLPKFETYEEGSQVRRSSKSVCANIVEGYALRKYKNEYLHHLYRAYGSSEETLLHLEELFSTGSLTAKEVYDELSSAYRTLNAKLFNFIQSIEREFETLQFLKEPASSYTIQDSLAEDMNPEP
jgi:four helix bundle protein